MTYPDPPNGGAHLPTPPDSHEPATSSQPPAAATPKPKVLLLILAGVCALGVLTYGAALMIAGSPETSTTAATGPDPGGATAPAASATPRTAGPEARATTRAPARAAIGDQSRDGQFEFVVRSVKCGRTKVGGELLNQAAQGVFCMVEVVVRNIGTQAQMFHGSAQKAYDAKGTEYSNDSTAEMYASEENNTFLQAINPGNQVKGTLVFDVPKGTKLTRLELHDPPWSGGVTVSLR